MSSNSSEKPDFKIDSTKCILHKSQHRKSIWGTPHHINAQTIKEKNWPLAPEGGYICDRGFHFLYDAWRSEHKSDSNV